MFARPSTQKKTSTAKKAPTLQKTVKRAIPPNTNSRNNQPRSPVINKIASIRTLPPFSAFLNSSSGQNSQRKSFQYSESNSEMENWRDQDQLFTNSSVNDAINTIDQELRDVLETIRKERNLIDLKICKLRAKMQQTRSRSNTRRQQISTISQNKVQVATLTEDPPNLEKRQKKSKNQKLESCQKQVQYPDKASLSVYFRNLALSLGLINEQQSIRIYEKEVREIEEQTKIRQNKLILEMLIQKMGNI